MAKLLVFLLIATAVAVMSAPTEEVQQELEEHLRLPRATCDLLSGFGVADSACAAGCLARGKRGGWCEKGVCHCRN